MHQSTQKDIQNILRLMNEDMPVSGSTIDMSGARYAQEAELGDLGTNILPGFNDQGSMPELSLNEQYSEKEIKIGKRFVELIGGHQRARDLLDKIIQSDQIFGITDEEEDASRIEEIAQAIPDHPDLATNFSARFNPSSY